MCSRLLLAIATAWSYPPWLQLAPWWGMAWGSSGSHPHHLLSLGAAPTAGPHLGIGAMARFHAALASTIAANLLWRCAEW
jgi:hypothetical protein